MQKKYWYHNLRLKLLVVLCAVMLLGQGLFVRPALARPADLYQPRTSLRVVSWGTGRLDIFTRSVWDAAIWVKTFDNGQWSSWTSLGKPTSNGFEALEAVSWGFGRLDVFGVEFNGSRTVWHKAWDGTSWGAWENIGAVEVGGGGSADWAGSGGIRAVSWGPGRIDLFTSGTYSSAGNGTLLQHKAFNTGTWLPSQTGWEAIGTASVGAGYKIDAVTWGPNRLDVFRRKEDTSSLDRRYWNGTSWKPSTFGLPTWSNMSGWSPWAPTSVSWGANRIDVFVRGTDGGIYLANTSDGTNWSGWSSLGGGGSATYGPPTADAWGPNRLDVFENRKTGSFSGNVYHNAWNGSAWTGWEHLGSVSFSYSPEVVSWSANRLDLFAIDSTGIVHKWWDGSGWGPSQTGAWENLGNP